MARILIVEDNESIREGVAAYLRQDGHEVETRVDGSDFDALLQGFDLFILDIMLPGRDGRTLARELLRETKAPFLFLTAWDAEEARIEGFELGASDYVVKPFSPRELVHRVRAILRRPASETPTRTFRLDGHCLQVNAMAHTLVLNGQPVELTPGERSFLETFAEAPGAVLSRKALMSRALSYYVDSGERTVDTHIKNLRSKLGPAAWIETVRGFGYRFDGVPGEGS